MVRADRRSLVRGLAQAALLAPAAFAVHQLRYVLAFGGSAGIQLQRTGHSYLHSVVPWLMLVLALVVGVFLRALGRACAGQRSVPRFTISLAGLWLVCSASLVAIFACQEFVEGLFILGHPAGLVGIFGYGGWWSIPAALCVGLVLAAVFHGARWVLNEVADRCVRPAASASRLLVSVSRPSDVLVARMSPLAGGWSGRGPPV